MISPLGRENISLREIFPEGRYLKGGKKSPLGGAREKSDFWAPGKVAPREKNIALRENKYRPKGEKISPLGGAREKSDFWAPRKVAPREKEYRP